MGDIGGIASAAGNVAGAEISASSAQAINQQQMAFNAQQGQITRDWETQMSNTAMQRRVDDLKAANLNPLLAIAQGGASSPVASAPSAGNLQNPGAAWQNLGSNIVGPIATAMQAKLAGAQADQASAQAALTRNQTPAPKTSAIDPETGEVTVNAYPGHELGDANVKNIMSSAGLNEQQALQSKRAVDLIGEQLYATGGQAAAAFAQAQLAGAQEAVVRGTLSAVIQQAMQDAKMGKAKSDIMGDPNWGPVLQAIQALLPAATSAVRAAAPGGLIR